MSAEAVDEGTSALEGRWAAASERLNPILVKEVRQALRGPNFRRAYLLVLGVAGAFGVWALLSGYSYGGSQDIGRRLFSAQFIALSIGLCALLPVQAYQTLGTEREEHTLELLLLSGLSPARIVNGKLVSVLAQGLVLLSAFLPLLALSYLLRGVDLFAILALVLLCVMASAVACSVAALLSANITRRMTRVLGIGLVAFGGVGVTAMMSGYATAGLSEFGDIGRDSELLFGFVAAGLAGGCVIALLLAGARAGFAHAEDDSLRSLRSSTLVSAGLACALALAGTVWPGLDNQVPLGVLVGASILLSVPFLFLMTDRERLGQHVIEQLRAGRRRRLAPLPGGARGTLLFIGVGAALLLTLFAVVTLSSGLRSDDVSLAVIPVGFTAFYIGLPSALLSRFTRTPLGRVRVAVVLFAFGCIVVPMVLGGFVGDRDLARGEHFLNFFFAMNEGDDGVPPALGLGLLGLLANVPRLLTRNRAGLATAGASA
jgi:hypothetical protein